MARIRKAPQVEDINIRKPSKHLFDFSRALDMTGTAYHRYRINIERYYNEHTGRKDLNTFVLKWMKANEYSSNDIKKVEKYGASVTTGIMAKMLASGAPDYHPGEAEYYDQCEGIKNPLMKISDGIRMLLDMDIKRYPDVEEEQKVETPVKRISIQDRMLEQVSPLIDQWEVYVDEIIAGVKKAKDFDLMREIQGYEPEVKAAQAKIIGNYFLQQYADLKENIQNEEYKHIPKDTIKVLNEIEKITVFMSEAKKAVRKPRAKKPVPNDKLVARMKYLDKDNSLGIVSINPTEIIEAKVVYLFNTKRSTMTRYVADDLLSLSVKGTSIINFCNIKSETRKLRKPQEMLAEMKKLTPAKRAKYFSELTTKPSVPNGRVGKDTVILYSK